MRRFVPIGFGLMGLAVISLQGILIAQERPSWFVPKLTKELARAEFVGFILKPSNLPPGCEYVGGKKTKILNIRNEPEFSIVKIKYRFNCIHVLSRVPPVYPKVKSHDDGSVDPGRGAYESSESLSGTYTESFVFRWTGEKWQLEGKLKEKPQIHKDSSVETPPEPD